MSIPDVRLGRAAPLSAQHVTQHLRSSGSRFAEMAASAPSSQAHGRQDGVHPASNPNAPQAAIAHDAVPQTNDPSTTALSEAGRRILARVARGERYVEQVVRGAASGTAYTPADLLAIQAQVYRHTQDVELVSKFVDRATSAVKTVLQQGGS